MCVQRLRLSQAATDADGSWPLCRLSMWQGNIAVEPVDAWYGRSDVVGVDMAMLAVYAVRIRRAAR